MEELKINGNGCFLIIVGILIIWYTSTKPKSFFFSIKAKGYIAGITFVLIGIIYILNELHLW